MPLSDRFREISSQVRNWGRWGPDDQLGTLNLITPEVVLAARDCIRHGRTIPLAVGLEHDGIQVGFVPGRDNPTMTLHAINEGMDPDGGPDSFHTSDDHVSLGLQAGTHWDGLCHVSYSGMVYNGYDASSITAAEGATRCGIQHLRSVCTRGVLLDVAASKQEDCLEPGYAVTVEDLEECCARQGVTVEPGSVVLVRTGNARHWDDPERYLAGPGISAEASRWLAGSRPLAVGADNVAWDVPGVKDPELGCTLPGHLILLAQSGIYIIENLMLEELASAGVHRFRFVCTPLKLVGATGSPVRPVAVLGR
jgi:kynurenine formamidase